MDYIKIPLYLSGPNATVDRTDSVTIGTAGSYGVHAFEVERGRNWDNLSIKATFYQKPDNGENTTTPSEDVIQISVVETGDGLIPIPNELFETETDEVDSAQPQTWVTFSGYDGENLKMNSLRLMLEISDTGPTYTTAFTPTPDIEEQLINAVKELRDAACECATQAGEYSAEAAKSATAAKTSEQNALDSENNAAVSELAAEMSAQSAEESEVKAKQHEDNTQILYEQTKVVADEAVQKVENAKEEALESLGNSVSQAAASASAAKQSETNAKASETNAASSASAAKTSETNAAESEKNAKASEGAAKVSETNAKTSETNAKASETAAKSSQDATKASADAAKSSENKAASSASTAQSSATLAITQAQEAQKYAGQAQTAQQTTNQYVTIVNAAKEDVEEYRDATRGYMQTAQQAATAAQTSRDEASGFAQQVEERIEDAEEFKNQASDSATAAAQSAGQAQSAATNAAAQLELVKDAGEDALKAITNQQATSVLVVQREGDAAVTEIGEAKEDALSAISEASTTVTTAITTAQETATTAIDTALDEATQAITAAKEEAASDIDAIVVNSPQINTETGYWMTWDKNVDDYVDTTTLARGPQGIQGEKGETGAVPQFGVVNVTTGEEGTEASASVTGPAENPVLNITIPKGDTGEKGDKGDTGATPNLTIGTVTTVAPDVDASITINGTAENPVLNMNIPQGETGEMGPGVQAGGTTGQILVKKSDTDFDTEWRTVDSVNPPEYTIVKQAIAEDGYFATYYLTRNDAQTGEKINIPKDYLVKEAELLEVTEADVPYSGAVIGDKYIDFTINTQTADEDERHIYLPVKDLVDTYVAGNGISIADNTISAKIDTANANGLAVDASGIKLNLATSTTTGAMSGADKAKLDASSTTEQMNQAISNAIDETLAEIIEDPTKLPFVNINGDTMHGSLTTTELFADFVTIRNAGTDGQTGFQSNRDTNHIRVFDQVENALVPIEVGEPTNSQDASTKKYVDDQIKPLAQRITTAEEEIDTLQSDMTTAKSDIAAINTNITNITNGTTELPYIPSDGGTISGPIIYENAPQEAQELANKAYVDASDTGAVESAKEYTDMQIEAAKAYTDEAVTNLTNGTTALPYVTKEEVDISGNPQEVARAYRYTFNGELDTARKSSGFGFIDLTPAIVAEVDGTTDFSPLYVGEPEKDIQAATKKYVDESIEAIDVSAQIAPLTERVTTAEGEIDALQTEVSNIKDGATTLSYMKVTDPNYTGTMSGVNATFSGDVVVPTPDADGEAANKSYVDSTVSTAKTEINGEIEDIKDGTTELSYIKDSGDSVTGNYSIAGTVTDTVSRTSNLQLANLNTTPDQWADAEYANVKYNSTDKRVDFSLMTNTGLITNGVKVSGAEPEEANDFTTKNYVDTAVSGAKSEATNALSAAKTELEGDIGTVQQTVMQQTETIDILSQTLSGITQGTMALPYVKKAGDTMSGELIVDTTGSAESPNVVTKISGGYAAFGDSADADYALTIGFNEGNDYPSIDFNDDEGDGGAIHIKPETVTSLGITTDTGYANVRLADPVENDDAATKRYVDEGGNNPAGLISVPDAVLRSNGEITLAPIEIIDSAPGININSFTLYGISTTNNPENLISPDIFEDGYYNSSGSKLTDTNGLSFSFDVQDGINTYYVSYSGTLKQDIASYSYAITEVLSTGDVYGTRGDSGAVPDTITIANTGGQPAKTSKIIVSIYGTNFSTVQNEVAIAITLGHLQIGTDYMLSPDHPKDITGIKTSENNQIAYLNVSQSENSIDNPLTEYLSYLNITNELHGFFSAVYINRGADFDLNGFDCFYDDTAPLNIFDTYIVFCADKYTYNTNKYTKNIGSITIDGDNASSLLSVAQLPTFTRGGSGGSTLTPATSLNVIKINVENCVAGKIFTSINGPTFNHVDRASIASGMSIRNKQYIVSTHFSPIRVDDIKNVSIYQTPLNDNTIFYGWSFTETPVDIESFESNFQFDGSICFYSSKITTVEQAISYFTSNPLTVKYVLKEPEIYNIPTEDYFSYKSIDRILDGSNYIGVINVPMVSGEPDLSSESMLVPFSIKYYNDYQKRIDYIYSAIYNLPTQSDVDKAKEKREQITSWSDDGYTFPSSMEYNTLYIFDKTTAIPTLTIESFRTPSDTTYVYTYHFIFRSGATPTVLTLPPDVILPDGFEIEANRIYEINIMENLLSYQSWPDEA